MNTLGPIVESFLSACATEGLAAGSPNSRTLAPAVCLAVHSGRWRDAARLARGLSLRWSAGWARETAMGFEAFAALEGGGRHVVLRAALAMGQALPSQAPIYPAADRPERHAHDLLGIPFSGQPDNRRWVRHQAWPAGEYPLRHDFPADQWPATAPPDDLYPFATAQGAGVVEIPVGPVHAGIIEPGHFRFLAVGETVLNLEQRLGYVHKGIEKLAVGRDAEGLSRLAARISGDSTVAHGWAACQALEHAAGVEVPQRALWLRAVMLERERVANHIGDIGAICTDVAFSFGQYQLSRLRELWQRASYAAFGHRLMMDCVVPGGIATDLEGAAALEMAGEARRIAVEFRAIIDRLEASESLEDRLMTTGRLAPELALQLGVVGYVAKASGQGFDLRVDSPQPPYDRWPLVVPCYRAGDVAARARVRAEEALASLELLGRLLESLPEGPTRVPWPSQAGAGEGLGLVEAWRGELLSYVRLDAAGRVERFFPRDPSWLNWPALELMIQGNIVPDFPVCNKSVNGSYSGQDL